MEAGDAALAGGLEQRLCPEHVGADESAWIQHGEAVVRLGGEIHDHVDRFALEDVGHEIEIADVTLDEGEPAFDVDEIVAIAGVGEEIEGDHSVAGVRERPSAARNSTR